VALVAVQRSIQGAHLQWYDVRLASSLRIIEFGELYAAPDAGAILTAIYPPLAHVFYLPAALFGSPNSALVGGSALAILACFAAVAWTILVRAKGLILAGRVFLFTAWYLASSELLVGVWGIHSDALAYTFGLVALALAVRWRAIPAAVASACAVWAKQTAVPFVVCILATTYFGERVAWQFGLAFQ